MYYRKYMSKISVYNPEIDAVLDNRIDIKTNDLEEFSIANKNIIVSFSHDGLLKSIKVKSSGKKYPVSLKFVQ